MNKKLVATLILVLVVNLLAAPMVMAEETDQEEETDEEEIHTLDELVVIASKHPEKLSEAPVSVEKIDEEDIEKKNAHDVADLLRGVAGVNIRDNGGVAGQKIISIRGSDAEQVLILVDGQEMNSSQNGTVDLSQLTIEQIEQIEVLRGPASTLYGANALGGVVNIITKNGSQEPKTTINLGYGSFNTQKYDLIHRGQSDKLDYNVSVSKKESDGHRDNSELEQKNIFTKFNYDLNEYSDLLLSLKYTDSDKGSPGPVSFPNPNAYQNDEDMNINLQWDRKTGNSDSKVAFYYNDHQNIYENPDTSEYSDHDTEKLSLDFNQIKYYDFHTLSYGGEIVKDRIDSNENGEHETLNKAILIQDEWRMNDDLKINLGARYDDHEMFGGETSPRLGSVYTINPKLNLHVSVAKAYRAPTFNELYYPKKDYSMFPDGAIYEGNPNVKPETAIAYETGLRYLDDNFKGEVNIFEKDVDDLIDWKEGDDGIRRPSNVNSAKILGGEVILTKYLTKQLSTNFNYVYLDARDEETDERLDSRNYHNLNLGLNYSTEKISCSLNGKLVAGRIDELPSYFVTDLKLNKQFTDNAKVSLEINNLLDRKYQVVDDYPMPGRNVMLNLSREF